MLAQHVYTDNSDRNLEKLIYNNDGVDSFTSVDDDNRITKVAYALASQSYVYNAYGRIESLTTKHNSTTVLTETLGYQGQSTQVATYTADAANYDKTWTYTYDDNGNILSVSDGVYTTSYQYDSANQLIRENNQAGGFTYVWVYDDAGNIVVREEYPYTTGTVGPVLDALYYTYGNSNWGDQLTGYDGMLITYDTIGNPLSYLGWTFNWEQGRQLASMSKSGTTWTFTYDASGLRTQRTKGTNIYRYTYHGSQLTHMTYNGTALHFSYDVNGYPLSLVYGGNTYYYATNLQGDVVAILDSTGAAVVTYTYDAWGKPLTTVDNTSFGLGDLNPLRYRGYVYDHETGLYYLQYRYYNPEWGRFLNADSQLSTGDFSGLNLFTYCGNNPVNRVDPTGQDWWHWAIGAAIVVGFGIATVVTCGGFAAAVTAVGLVSSGVALTSATATAVTMGFIGSASIYGVAVLSAASNSSSLQDFANQGNWGTVIGTALGAGFGFVDGYTMYRSQAAQYQNAYNYSGGKNESYTQKRGWTDQSIRHAIQNGRQGTTTNRAGEACTAYGYPGIDNQYVVINNSTRSIVQVSNLNDPGWIVDDRIIWAN